MHFDRDYTMTIDGNAVTASQTEPVVNPATGEEIAEVPSATREQLDAAVAAARRAFPAWAARPYGERQQLISALGDVFEEHKEQWMALLTREVGKARANADWEVSKTILWCREIPKRELPVHTVEDVPGHTFQSRRVPIGVVGAITPWNYPLLLAFFKLLPALLAGNTVVLKPSPYTPLTTLKFGEFFRDLLPPGVLNVVSGGNELGQWMTAHPHIGKISFTGSTETGRKIMESAAGNFKRLTLELGGNDAAIVLADADPERIAPGLFWMAFQNSAQLCFAAKRVYIHEDIYDRVAGALVAYARTVKVGNGADPEVGLGPIQNRMQYEKVKELIADSKARGHRFLLGGEVPEGPGYFVPVTIIDNPPEDARVVVEEAFGPVLPLLRFKDVDDAIERANGTIYGLGGSVWGGDPVAARQVAERLDSGIVWVNEDQAMSPHAILSGHKQSGLGAENALEGLLEFTNAQTIVGSHLGRVA